MELIQVDALHAEISQAKLQLLPEIFGTAHGRPGVRALAGEAAFGRDHQALPVRRQCVADQRLTDRWTVRVGGIDKIYAELDRTPQHTPRFFRIFGVAPNSISGNPHGSKAESVNG